MAGVAVDLAQELIAEAQSLLTEQTWGSGNLLAGLAAIVPQVLLAQAALSLSTWETATPTAQAWYADTAGIPIVHQVSGLVLLGALLLPTLATTALNSTDFLLPLVGAFESSGTVTTVENLVSTAAENGRVYGVVLVTMKAGTEPVVYISVNGGPSVPVLVDTGSSGLVLTSSSVNMDGLVATGSGSVTYSGDVSQTFDYNEYTTTVNFGNGIVTNPTTVDIIVDEAESDAWLSLWSTGGFVGILGIGANSYGPGPSVPTAALTGEMSDGVFLYQGLFFGLAGVMVLGPNPLPVRASVTGASIAYVDVKTNNTTTQDVSAIIDSGGVYGTWYTYLAVGTKVSVYSSDGTLLYSYTITSTNRPTVISSGLINTGYIAFQQGPVYIDYTAPNGVGATDFDYA